MTMPGSFCVPVWSFKDRPAIPEGSCLTFTLTGLQKAYETIQGKPLLTPNFRRKIAGYVTETEQMSDGAGHRPAKLYRRNLDAFYRE